MSERANKNDDAMLKYGLESLGYIVRCNVTTAWTAEITTTSGPYVTKKYGDLLNVTSPADISSLRYSESRRRHMYKVQMIRLPLPFRIRLDSLHLCMSTLKVVYKAPPRVDDEAIWISRYGEHGVNRSVELPNPTFLVTREPWEDRVRRAWCE